MTIIRIAQTIEHEAISSANVKHKDSNGISKKDKIFKET